MIQVIKTLEELEALKNNWENLFTLASTATPYQAWHFVMTTWQVWHKSDDKLYIICYNQSKGKAFDAILPCYIDKEANLHLMDYMTDFCEGIIPDSLLECYDMYYEIVQFLEKDKNVHSLCFDNLRQGSRLMAYLYGLGGYSKIEALTGYTIVRMKYSENNQDFVDSIIGCKSKHRKKLRKVINDIGNCTMCVLQNTDPYPEKEIRELGDYMISEGMRTRAYLDDNFFAYFKNLYQNGQLVLMLLYKEDKLCACKFMLQDKHTNELVSWVVLYRNNKNNSELAMLSLDYMYKNGIFNLNYARGVYAYKLSKFHPNVYILNRLRVYRSQRDATMDLGRIYLGKMKRLIYRKLHGK